MPGLQLKESEVKHMSTYPLKPNKYNWRDLRPDQTFYTEDYIRDHYDLYLSTEHIKDEYGEVRRYYRLHASKPHSIEMALAYDVRCPHCDSHKLKQVGRCLSFHELGLYECPICDKKNRR